MATQHLTTTTSLCELFNESKLCPDEILNVLHTLDNNNTNNNKRKKPSKNTTSSSSLGLGFDKKSDEGRAGLSPRKGIKRQNVSLSPSATSMEDGRGGGVGGSSKNGKLVSHVAVERNRRMQMNEHLAVLRQLIPSFYVKKGDQASIVGGVIDYINELHQVHQSLESKKRRKIYTSEVGLSPKVVSSPRFLAAQQHLIPLPLSQRKPQLSPRLLLNFPVSPGTPQSTSSLYKPIGQPQTKDVGNELVASSKSNSADVQVKFCGPNLELRTLSSKITGQTVKILSAIEDQSLEILQLSINTAEETVLTMITIKIGIDCQLSAEELSQRIQQTFC